MKLDGYIRVSRVNGREGDSFISPEQQRDKIEAFAKVMDAEIVEWHTDLDQSGGKISRPGLNKAMRRIEAKQTDGLIVAKIDRFARAVEAYAVIRRILEAEAVFASADERLDPSTPMGKAMLQIVLVFAEMELDRIRESWADAKKRAVERDLWIGRDTFGYRKRVVGIKKNDKPAYGPLEPHPDEGPVVTEAYRLAAGEGWSAARRYLEREAPHRRWRPEVVRRLLSSRVYLGESFLGELAKVDAHEPLTTPELYAAVQTLPEMRSTPRKASGDYVLSGVARCGKCGGGMIGQLQTVKGVQRRRLRCGCGGGASITADGLEEFVRDRVGVALAARATVVRVESAPLYEAQEALALAESDLTRWLADDRTRELIGDELFHQGVEGRLEKLAEARERYQHVSSQVARAEVIPAISDLEDPEQFARAVAAMVKAVKVKPGRGSTGERATIEWAECLNAETPETRARSPFETTASEQTIEAGMKGLAEGQRQRFPGAVVEAILPDRASRRHWAPPVPPVGPGDWGPHCRPFARRV